MVLQLALPGRFRGSGRDKTTVRGGYQITFQGGGRFSALEGPLSNPPGKTYSRNLRGDSTNLYLDLTQSWRV